MKRVWLENILQKRGLTHHEVAELAFIDRAYFTQIVNGSRRPSPSVAQRIGKVLGFDWTIFFNEDGGVKPQRCEQPNDEQAATVEKRAG